MSLFLKRGLAAVLAVYVVLSYPPAMQGKSLTFTTFAGPEGGAGFDDGTGSAARFFNPRAVATDISGNTYVADSSNHTIRKITPAGAVTTLAGLAGSSGSADGTGSAARFNNPVGVATDMSGNVYVGDSGNHTIRKITPSGTATTLAGVAGINGSADGTGSAAQFNRPNGVATDSSGNVYVADTFNNTIRKITSTGAVTTLAGLAGMSGITDGTGSDARFYSAIGVATDGSGNVYVADTICTIRKISPGGAVTTLAGLAGSCRAADGTGRLARFNNPNGVATDSSGNVYVSDTSNQTIRKITPAGAVTTLVGLVGTLGTADGTGSGARFNSPFGVATDSSGNLYIADTSNNTIRKITAAGAVTTHAGLAASVGSADGTGSGARFNSPFGVATDSSGNVYIADTRNSTIRKITQAALVTTLVGLAGTGGIADGTGGAARFNLPFGVATDSSGNVYVADTLNHSIRMITPAGAVTTLAGLAGSQGRADGTGSAARFNHPKGVATDSGGNVYVADAVNITIRKITPAGAVSTLGGLAGNGGGADGTGSAARFNNPNGVATDSSGNVYVADVNSSTIRKITPAGAVTTLAGLFGHFESADGTGSAARFNAATGVATDSSGNVYVADMFNNTIRKITPGGTVTTLGGLAGISGSADGAGSAARFNNPFGVATDSSGNVYVADTGNNTIRIGRVALADVATIDVSAALSGSTRLLDTAPQTATSWQWSVIRRPADSVAVLSSASVRNPTFTPDVPGLFIFRLIATGAGTSSITTVDLTAIAAGSRRRSVRR